MKTWTPDLSRSSGPRYMAIADVIEMDLRSGHLVAGDRLPPQRELAKRLGIDFGETTGDGKFTLKEGECMGACGDAPVVLVNNKRMASFMNPSALDTLIDELSAAADRGEGWGPAPKTK